MIDHESLKLAGFREEPFSGPSQHTKWVKGACMMAPGGHGRLGVVFFFGPGSPRAHAVFDSDDKRYGPSCSMSVGFDPQGDEIVTVLGRLQTCLEFLSERVGRLPGERE